MAVSRFDDSSQAPPELDLPDLLGDMNLDKSISLEDAYSIVKCASGLEPILFEERKRADLDFDDKITTDDALIVAEAVIDSQLLPRKLLPETASPGKLVTIISPELMSLEGEFTVQVGNSTFIQKPLRVVRGYANIIVPFDPVIPDSMVVTDGIVEVKLLKNGVPVDTFTLNLQKPTPLPDNPREELSLLLDEMIQILTVYESITMEQLSELDLTQENFDILMGIVSVAKIEASQVFNEMKKLLESNEGEELAKLFLLVANANGLEEARMTLQSALQENAIIPQTFSVFSLARSNSPGDELLKGLCQIKTVVKAINTTSTIISLSCDALLVGTLIAAAVPADGPAVDLTLLGTWVTLCAKAELAISAAKVVTDIVGVADADLNLTAVPANPQSGESVKINVTLEVVGIDDLCGLGANKGLDWIEKKLAERAVHELLRRKASLRAIFRVFQKFGGDYYNMLLEKLQKTAKLAINKTKASQAIESFINGQCDRFGGVDVPLDAKSTIKGPNPNLGTLTFLPDGSAEYICGICDGQSSCPSSISFTAEKNICGKTKNKTVKVNCQTLANITITIGDNGSLNDDIFEVRIDGETILTSSSPVRSVSTTIQIPIEDTWVQMIGRAAPDGIGTYYIRFSGASVIGGDHTSGYDLTPGKVKNFFIRPTN